MRTIAKLFGRSPFVSLQAHLECVADCVEKMLELLVAFQKGDHATVNRLAPDVSELEHAADQVKHDIQDSLTQRRLFLPIERGRLLEIIGTQDSIADKAENIAVLLTFKDLEMVEAFRSDFAEFVTVNIEAFHVVIRIINQLDELLETSFGGAEAVKVKELVDEVALLEYKADRIQHTLLKGLFANEVDMSAGTFYMWTNLIKQISEISNLSERLANRVRTTLELK